MKKKCNNNGEINTFDFSKSYDYSTNIIPLDYIFGGCIRSGSMIQVISEPGVGKTIFLLGLVKNLVLNDYNVLFIDVDGKVDNQKIKDFGFENFLNKKLMIHRESTFESVERVLDHYVNEGNINFVFIHVKFVI